MRAKKLLSVVLAFVMVLSLLPMSALAVTYPDANDAAWAKEAIDRWSDYGIVSGDETGFRPNANMKRGEAAKVFANLFGLSDKTAKTTFSDLTSDKWYYDYLNMCVNAGIMNGMDGLANGDGTMTREMFFVMFARGLGLKEQTTTSGPKADGASWSTGYINALTDKGYVGGMDVDGDGVLEANATGNINRASVMALLNQTIDTYIDKAGTYTLTDGKGIVLVNAAGVTLTGTTAKDVVIAKGADNGSVNFEKATINGTVTVQADNAKVTADKDSKLASAPVVNGAGTTYTAADGTKTTTGGAGGNGYIPSTVANTNVTTDGAEVTGTVNGNLTITKDVGEGEVTLDGATVTGDLIIEGGGGSSIILKNGTSIGGDIILRKTLTVSNPTPPSLKLQGNTIAGSVKVEKEAAIQASANANAPSKIEATANVTLEAKAADGSGTTATFPAVEAKGSDVTVNVDTGATLSSVTATGESTTITGGGSITDVTASNNVEISGASVTGTVEVPAGVNQAVTITVAEGGSIAKVEANGAASIEAGANGGTVTNVEVSAPVEIKTNVAIAVTVPENAENASITVTDAAIPTLNVNAPATIASSGSDTGSSIGEVKAAVSVTINAENATIGKVTVDSSTLTSGNALKNQAVTVTAEAGSVAEVVAKTSTTVAADSASSTASVAAVTVAAATATVTVDAKVVDSVAVASDVTSGAVDINVTDSSGNGSSEIKVDVDTASATTIAVATDNTIDSSKVGLESDGQVTSVAGSTTAADHRDAATLDNATADITTKTKAPTNVALNETATSATVSFASGTYTVRVYTDSSLSTLAGEAVAMVSADTSAEVTIDPTKVVGPVYATIQASGENESSATASNYTALTFTYESASHNVAGGEAGAGASVSIDFSSAVTGGAKGDGYKFSSTNLPGWLTLTEAGALSLAAAQDGKLPTSPAAATTATITVTDAAGKTASVTINIGAITEIASETPTVAWADSDNKTIKVTFSGNTYALANGDKFLVYENATTGTAMFTETVTTEKATAFNSAKASGYSFALTNYATADVYVTYLKNESGYMASEKKTLKKAALSAAIDDGQEAAKLTRGVAKDVDVKVTLANASFADGTIAVTGFAATVPSNVTATVKSVTRDATHANKATVKLTLTAAKAAENGTISKIEIPAVAVKGASAKVDAGTNTVALTVVNPAGVYFNGEKIRDAVTGAEAANVKLEEKDYNYYTVSAEGETAGLTTTNDENSVQLGAVHSVAQTRWSNWAYTNDSHINTSDPETYTAYQNNNVKQGLHVVVTSPKWAESYGAWVDDQWTKFTGGTKNEAIATALSDGSLKQAKVQSATADANSDLTAEGVTVKYLAYTTATTIPVHTATGGAHRAANWVGVGVPRSSGDTFASGYGALSAVPSEFAASTGNFVGYERGGGMATFFFDAAQGSNAWIATKTSSGIVVYLIIFDVTTSEDAVECEDAAFWSYVGTEATEEGETITFTLIAGDNENCVDAIEIEGLTVNTDFTFEITDNNVKHDGSNRGDYYKPSIAVTITKASVERLESAESVTVTFKKGTTKLGTLEVDMPDEG